MKKIALIINYFTFIVLLLSLLMESCALFQSAKYVLLIASAYMLFRITSIYGGKSAFHKFNYLFLSVIVVFVIYALIARSGLYMNIVIQLLIAAIVGLILSLSYRQPVRPVKRTGIRPPAKPKARKVKKTTKKATSRKKTSSNSRKSASRSQTSAKKRGPGRPPKKKTAKKTSKKKATSKKSTKKKSTKKASKKSSSKKTTKKSASKKSSTNIK